MSSSVSEQSEPIRSKPHKLFITGLDGKSDLKELQDELRRIFGDYGDLESVVTKRSFNGAYCFAFIDYKEGEDATKAVQKQNGSTVHGKKMTVELQDNSRRRKGTGEGCYQCGKIGHFARECRNKSTTNGRGRSRSRSDQFRRKKHKRHRDSYSYSSDESRSRKKQKRKRSKSRRKKHSKSKKHKKDRKRRRSYSSDSN